MTYRRTKKKSYTDIQKEIIEEHQKIIEKAEKLYGKLPPCEIIFSSRLQRSVGRYRYEISCTEEMSDGAHKKIQLLVRKEDAILREIIPLLPKILPELLPEHFVESHIIEYSKKMVERAKWTLIHNVIPHEIAHFVCKVLRLEKVKHNDNWKKVCISLGGDGNEYWSGDIEEDIPLAILCKKKPVYDLFIDMTQEDVTTFEIEVKNSFKGPLLVLKQPTEGNDQCSVLKDDMNEEDIPLKQLLNRLKSSSTSMKTR